MSRRRQAVRRGVIEDAKYHSPLVRRLVNVVMHGGKKATAQKIVYGAFDQIVTKNPNGNIVVSTDPDPGKPADEKIERLLVTAVKQVSATCQ